MTMWKTLLVTSFAAAIAIACGGKGEGTGSLEKFTVEGDKVTFTNGDTGMVIRDDKGASVLIERKNAAGDMVGRYLYSQNAGKEFVASYQELSGDEVSKVTHYNPDGSIARTNFE